MQTVQRIASPSFCDFHADGGIESIIRKSAIEPILPGDVELQPASARAKPELVRLFPLQSYEDFIWERLTPEFRNLGFLRPERFRMMLRILKVDIRKLAMHRRISSRRYGRLAQILDDQDDLAKLAQMYFTSLLQG